MQRNFFASISNAENICQWSSGTLTKKTTHLTIKNSKQVIFKQVSSGGGRGACALGGTVQEAAFGGAKI